MELSFLLKVQVLALCNLATLQGLSSKRTTTTIEQNHFNQEVQTNLQMQEWVHSIIQMILSKMPSTKVGAKISTSLRTSSLLFTSPMEDTTSIPMPCTTSTSTTHRCSAVLQGQTLALNTEEVNPNKTLTFKTVLHQCHKTCPRLNKQWRNQLVL